jgi:DNA helicase-2/ATP-dependent DNA helicase PcrA
LNLLESLNPRQKQAVTHPGGPLLVVAGAGSGKTRVLAHRIAYLLSAMKVYPSEILAVTFTNKAAGEMGERVRGLAGRASQGMWMGTFHSVCARILRVEGKILGISSDFTIYDDRDQNILMKQIMGDLGISLTKFPPPAALAKISWAKSNLLGAEEVASMAGNPYEERIARLYSEYEKALRENNALDFDDLISLPVRLFKSSPEALERNAGRFRHVLIDEYQDTNRAQYGLVRLLSSIHRNVCAVGDDDQSIYRWRGADITNLLNFERDFPDATVIRLEQSYRSTKTILAASQAVIKCNVQRKEKELWTENAVGRKILVAALSSEWEEGEFLARSIEQAVREEDRRYSDFAVLYRTNAQSRAIEDGLRRSGLPYVIVGGTKFYERKEIKDILAYLRLLVNPRDAVSLARIINVPNRGIGNVTLSRLREFSGAGGITPSAALERADEIPGLNAGARRKLGAFKDLVEKLRAASGELGVPELITLVARESGYMEHLKEQGTVEALARAENIEELVAGGFEFQERSEEPTLQKFLEEVSLVTDIDLWDDRREAVSLMTLHNAKGLEFPVVSITGAEEGLIPHHTSFEDEEEMEEERRLFYVGMTRARERLMICLAAGRRGFRGWTAQMASRFLENIPEEFLEVMTPSGGTYIEEPRHHAGDRSRAGDRGNARRAGRRGRRSSGHDLQPDYSDYGEEKVVRIGTRVMHPDWGPGSVRGCEGYGAQLRLTVRFDSGIIKRILASYANLEMLDHD